MSFYDPEAKPTDFRKGQRVQLCPSTDRWMMGDRYGKVDKIGTTKVTVHFDVSGHRRRFHPSLLSGV